MDRVFLHYIYRDEQGLYILINLHNPIQNTDHLLYFKESKFIWLSYKQIYSLQFMRHYTL